MSMSRGDPASGSGPEGLSSQRAPPAPLLLPLPGPAERTVHSLLPEEAGLSTEEAALSTEEAGGNKTS